MPFRAPILNLVCNIWRAQATIPNPATTPPTLANVPCQLRATITGLHVEAPLTAQGFDLIILPPGTDVRAPLTGGSVSDLIECPAGTGRFYSVRTVYDRAKGFPNEHRIACGRQQTTVVGGWPYPTP